MVNQFFFGVAALLLFAAPLLLGVVAEESKGDVSELDLWVDVPMIDLNEELEVYYSRPRERRLDTATFVWCISQTNISDTALQSSLDWACGTGTNQGQVNCGPINVGGACYDPNTLQHHCDWAFNAYFQRNNATPSACDFQGAAQEVTTDPSSGTCVFPGSNLTVITNGTSNSPTSSPGTAPSPNGFSGATAALQPQFLFRISTAVILFTYLFT